MSMVLPGTYELDGRAVYNPVKWALQVCSVTLAPSTRLKI